MYELSGYGFESIAVTYTSDIAPVSSKEFLDIQTTMECTCTLNASLT